MITQHSKNVVLNIYWKNDDGTAKDLSSVTSVDGVLRSGKVPNETDTTIQGTISIADALTGHLVWTIHANDSANAGLLGLFLFANSPGPTITPSIMHILEVAPTPTPPT